MHAGTSSVFAHSNVTTQAARIAAHLLPTTSLDPTVRLTGHTTAHDTSPPPPQSAARTPSLTHPTWLPRRICMATAPSSLARCTDKHGRLTSQHRRSSSTCPRLIARGFRYLGHDNDAVCIEAVIERACVNTTGTYLENRPRSVVFSTQIFGPRHLEGTVCKHPRTTVRSWTYCAEMRTVSGPTGA